MKKQQPNFSKSLQEPSKGESWDRNLLSGKCLSKSLRAKSKFSARCESLCLVFNFCASSFHLKSSSPHCLLCTVWACVCLYISMQDCSCFPSQQLVLIKISQLINICEDLRISYGISTGLIHSHSIFTFQRSGIDREQAWERRERNTEELVEEWRSIAVRVRRVGKGQRLKEGGLSREGAMYTWESK